MKTIKTIDPKDYDDGMLPEYDFKGQKPIRGKYYRARQKGYTVRIHNEDGTVTEKHYGPMITLDPDVAAYFPDSESVNNALRTLIALVPEKQLAEPKAKYKVTRKPAKKTAAKK
jgi:hypothetical protein